MIPRTLIVSSNAGTVQISFVAPTAKNSDDIIRFLVYKSRDSHFSTALDSSNTILKYEFNKWYRYIGI